MSAKFNSSFSIRAILGTENEIEDVMETHHSTNNANVNPSIAENNEHAGNKPKYTYSSLIVMAIRSTPEKRMTLSGICDWIEENYPYYEENKNVWHNSIRHNLSYHSCFVCVPRALNDPGRGNYWTINPTAEDVTVGESTGRLRRSHSVRDQPLGATAVAPNPQNYQMGVAPPDAQMQFHMSHPYATHAVYFPTPEEIRLHQSMLWHDYYKDYY